MMEDAEHFDFVSLALRTDIEIGFLSSTEPFLSPAVDVPHQFRREFHELAPLRLL